MSKEQLKMPRLYQDKKWGTWYVEFERGVARSLRTKNQAEARKRFNIIKRRWSEGKLAHLTGQCSKTLGDFYKEFKAWSSLNQPRSTSRANILALEKLRNVAGDHIKLNELSLLHLDRMITECRRSTKEKPGGLSIASINNYIRHARAALNKAVDWNFITVNPLRKAKELPAPRKAPGFIPTLPEITRFLQSISDLDARRLAAAYLTTGRRRSEILGLHWDEVDLQGKRYFIRRSKNHLSTWYPLNSGFRSVLESLGGEGHGRIFKRWSHPDTISKVIKRALKDAGLEHLTLHSLRHTFASQAIMQGRTLRDVQDLLGHTESRTTEIYAHLADEHLAQAADIKLGPMDLMDNKRTKDEIAERIQKQKA